MTSKQLEDFIDRQQKICDRNYRNYQETGIPRYDQAYRKADKLIEIAQQALSAADDHQENITYHSELSDWGSRALELQRKWNEKEAFQLIKDIAAVAKLRGLAWDRYN